MIKVSTKKTFLKLLALSIFLFWTVPGFASLVDNGDGTITQTRTDGSKLMWLQDTSYAGTTGDPGYANDAAGIGMSWDDANVWANSLVFLGYTDWRLPSPLELNGTGPYFGYGSGATSEIGGLTGEGITFPTPSPFINMVYTSQFWTDYSLGEDDAVSYAFGYNGNVAMRKFIVLGPGNEPPRRLGAWAVRTLDTPTAITLSSFKAKQRGRKVLVRWRTSSEIDNLGFNVLRCDSENGTYTQVNKKLIPAKKNAVSGAKYKYRDRKVKKGTYYYKLEDIDKTTGSTVHDAVEVKAFKKKANKKKNKK